MTTFLAISTLALGALSIYLIKLIFREREYHLDVLCDLDDAREKIEAIEMANESFRKEFGELKEELVYVNAEKEMIRNLAKNQNEYFRGVFYDQENDTLVLAENLERLGEL